MFQRILAEHLRGLRMCLDLLADAEHLFHHLDGHQNGRIVYHFGFVQLHAERPPLDSTEISDLRVCVLVHWFPD